ncbi:hypothetical protein [Micromonospora sp. CPCC 206061]|uniref:hypothetical protein n=1 Tax=Micromonospora sp. CPCC 206061 TaxID=3122410 RepID=UPI002FF3B4F0
MSVNKRNAPRSGGRTAAQHQIIGNNALQPEPSESQPARTQSWLRVAPPLPVSVPRAPFIALILVVVVGGVLGILLVNTKINENAFRLEKLQQSQNALDIREQQLEQEIATAEDPGTLIAAAKKLGLVPGTPAQIRLPDGRVTGVPQPANGQPAITSQGAGR